MYTQSSSSIPLTQDMASKTFFTLLFTLLILFASQSEIRVAEARMCQSQSHMFHGTCMRSHNCALVCRNEGFSGGRCRGFRRRCFCTRLC